MDFLQCLLTDDIDDKKQYEVAKAIGTVKNTVPSPALNKLMNIEVVNSPTQQPMQQPLPIPHRIQPEIEGENRESFKRHYNNDPSATVEDVFCGSGISQCVHYNNCKYQQKMDQIVYELLKDGLIDYSLDILSKLEKKLDNFEKDYEKIKYANFV